MATRKSVADRLAELGAGIDEAPGRKRLEAALADRSYRVAAKAARLCAEFLVYDLEPHLLVAFERFLRAPARQDPGCVAKAAIARALVDLDCGAVEVFTAGLRCRQLEPVWGGTVDTAVDVRCSCAAGLVATGYGRALHELTALLTDEEARARIGAVRAVSCANPHQAEMLLRFKVLTGDPEPEVLAECFAALLRLEPDEAPAFVARYLSHSDAALREFAALALGESRLPVALAHLEAAWEQPIPQREYRSTLIRAVAMHRTDSAFDWLFAVIADEEESLAEETLRVLAIYRHDDRLSARARRAVTERQDPRLLERLSRIWEE